MNAKWTLLIVSALVALVIVGMIRDKRKGKSVTCGGCSGCSGNCAHCRAAHAEAIRTARALLKDAPIVLLDEATASLDVENETKVQGALSRLLAGKTVLVIAHRMRTVEAADKIVVLKDGRVAEVGAPKELFRNEAGLFRRMAELQAQSAAWSV